MENGTGKQFRKYTAQLINTVSRCLCRFAPAQQGLVTDNAYYCTKV